MKVLLWMIFWWAVLLRWEIHNMLINHICSPVLRAELWACRGLLSQRHASFFSQWPETGTHLHSLLSHSDDTASLSAERECTWCERIPHSLCAACVFKRFPQWFTFREECVESFVHIHFKPPIQAAKITMQKIFQLNHCANGPKTMSAIFGLNVFLSLAEGSLLWVCARKPGDLF